MRDSVDYKKKYLDLRAKMVSSMDMAFRMGYEKGSTDAAQQQMQQQMQQQAQQMAAMNQMQGMPQDQAASPDQNLSAEQGQGMPPQQEELDQYINELESLVSKGEISASDLKKSLEKIKNFQFNSRLAKSIKFEKTFKINDKALTNLSAHDKQNLSMQEQVIENIMKKWEAETPKTTSQAMQALGVEALTKGE